jgi:hypothetical protein
VAAPPPKREDLVPAGSGMTRTHLRSQEESSGGDAIPMEQREGVKGIESVHVYDRRVDA